MPDIATRTDHEEALAAALMLVFEHWRWRPMRTAEFRRDVQEAVTPILAAVHGDAAVGLAGVESFAMDNAAVGVRGMAWASKYAETLANEIAASTAGMTPETAFGYARAEAIAVTETTRAVTIGEAYLLIVMATETGESRKQPIWVTELDARVCPVCRPLHGTGRRVFGDVAPIGPPAHPRCRCTLSYREVA